MSKSQIYVVVKVLPDGDFHYEIDQLDFTGNI